MVPGKVFSADLLENEVSYFKFSYPSQEPDTSLNFQIEFEYGDFDVFVSRSNEFPSKESSDFFYQVTSQYSGLMDQFKDFEVKDSTMAKGSLTGHYFVAVKAQSTSHVRLKFYEKNKVEGEKH